MLTHPLRLPRGRRSRPIDLSIQILDFHLSVIPSVTHLAGTSQNTKPPFFCSKACLFYKGKFLLSTLRNLLAPNWSVRLSLTHLTTTFSLLNSWTTFLVCKTEPDPSYNNPLCRCPGNCSQVYNRTNLLRYTLDSCSEVY